jgi:hypothetical protein
VKCCYGKIQIALHSYTLFISSLTYILYVTNFFFLLFLHYIYHKLLIPCDAAVFFMLRFFFFLLFLHYIYHKLLIPCDAAVWITCQHNAENIGVKYEILLFYALFSPKTTRGNIHIFLNHSTNTIYGSWRLFKINSPAPVKIDGNLEGGIGLYRVQHYRVINNGGWEPTGAYGIRLRALSQREYQREVDVTSYLYFSF